jgi:peroxiredoxin
MEGKELPNYQFEDIAGHKYNNVNTRGKIIVLKCWFIHCVACVKEFPELNKLVDNYKNRKDILFVSLAFDNKKDLKSFLKMHRFNYDVVPNQQTFMMDRLSINTFPTHIIIGKDGKIRKAVDNYKDLLPALNKETLKE